MYFIKKYDPNFFYVFYKKNAIFFFFFFLRNCNFNIILTSFFFKHHKYKFRNILDSCLILLKEI